MLAMLLALLAPAPASAPPPRLDADTAAVTRTTAALDAHINGTWLDGKPGTDRLAETQWRALQHWATDWLDLHPQAGADALAGAGKHLGNDWSVSAVALDNGEMLVAVSRYQMSNVFILGADARGRHPLRWSSAAPQQSLDRAADHALAQWRPVVQNGNCGNCAMMAYADVGRLPTAADGAVRFWIEASYAQEMGATIGVQLSLWSWRHGQARPLLVDEFAAMVDQHRPAVRGTTLHVPSKREWRSLYACGSCFGRVTDLRFAVGPGRVRALTPVSETPELDLIDRVFARVLARQPVGALAAPPALRIIRAQLRDRLAEKDPPLRRLTGMVMGWGRWRTHGQRWACLSADETAGMAFSFDRDLRRITSARLLTGQACQGKDAHM
uniref:hypothetical protein n=1 Tax=Sphingomonas bacterium TaxID=1895847 RepID=UPI002623D478|nr:hypothetical protein [Sphingomonas bacterium]